MELTINEGYNLVKKVDDDWEIFYYDFYGKSKAELFSTLEKLNLKKRVANELKKQVKLVNGEDYSKLIYFDSLIDEVFRYVEDHTADYGKESIRACVKDFMNKYKNA
ncbi:MAG: hypothetical protein K5851_03585 [Lachnospiraceae bacterium]|nr:hypothetical protein [Lachnospiraceae bacterium]